MSVDIASFNNPYFVMGTGSRSLATQENRMEVYENLLYHVGGMNIELSKNNRELVIISGMAEGWDAALANVAIELDIPFMAYVPNKGYGKYYWGQHSLLGRDRYAQFQYLCSSAMHVRYVCNSIYENGRHANFIRNDAMVAVAHHALVYDAGSSGTKDAVKTIKAKGIPMEVYPFQTELKLFN